MILTPPSPATTGATPPPPPPPQPKPRKFFRKVFLAVFLITTLGFGGGVYYSRVNDNFHDFFTEYVPFGEEAVLYFEEMEFRNRYPRIANRSSKPRDTGESIKIPSKSGVSWKVAEDSRPGSSARHANATKDTPKQKEALQTPKETKPADEVKVAEVDKKEAAPPAPAKSPEPQAAPKPAHPVIVPSEPVAPKSSDALSFTAPEVDQPSKFPKDRIPSWCFRRQGSCLVLLDHRDMSWRFCRVCEISLKVSTMRRHSRSSVLAIKVSCSDTPPMRPQSSSP